MKTKMKFSKQLLSVLLCIAMLMSYMPMTAYAAASGACGDGVNWTLTDDGVLTISGSGVMPNYRMVAQVPYYSYRNEINEIVIESGVTAIGNLAFSGCENLKKLTIKGDINRIGARAFAQCSAITEITYCGVNAPSDLGTNIWVNGLDISVAVPENYAEGVETFANLSVSRTLPATGGEAETPTYEVKIVGHTTDTGVAVKSIISDGVAAERATHGKDLTVVLEITGEGTVDEVYVRYIEIGTDRYYFADEDCPVTLNVETLTVTIPGNLVDGTVAIDTGIMLNVIVNLEGGYLKDTNYGKRWYDADPSDDVAALSKDYAFYGYGGSWAWNDCFARDGYILKEITSNLAQHGPYDPDRDVGPVLDRDMELTLVWEECTVHNYVNGTCEHCGQAQHTHNWTYTVNDAKDTITATCIADGCTAKDGGSVKLVAPTELTYNGTAKEATLQFDNWQLGDDAKPTISYNDTDKVAVTNKDIVATITLGVESASVTYKVKPASISGATVTADTVNYTGNAQTPDVSVVLNGKTLVKDTDYTVSYNNNTNAGTATVTVTGTGNYEGTATGTFTITDTAEPTGAILIKDNTWLQFLNNITFGLFFKENVDVIVTADGTGSAVDKVEYLFSSTELNKNNLPADGWKTVKGNNGTYTFAITARNKGAVYVKITDAYGNVAVINSDGIVVYTDSKVAEDTVYFTYQSTEDAVIDLELNGNTVKNVLFNGHEITNYWSVGGNKLTLDADYLGRLVVLDNGAGYPVTVYFNPLGVETEKVELKDEFTLVIQKADGSVTNISNIGKTYDGTSVSEPTFDKLGDGMATIEYKVKGAEDSTYTTEVPKNAGDYVVRVSVAEGTNYNEAYGTAEFKIEKADAEIDDNPAAINGLIYNGDPQALVSAGSTEDGIIKYSLDGVVYSTNIPKGTNAGTYSVYVRIVGDENHNNSDLMPVEVKIDKATVTEPTIASKPYTGSAQTADIVDTDLYTVEQNNGGTAQGSYDVVLKLKDADNYKWATTDNAEVTVKFVISAAENAWKVAPSISGWTYGENAKAPTYEAKFGTVKVTYTGKANDGSDYNSETAPTKAGNYTATFTVEGTADYSGLSESVDFTIAKATYDMSSAKWNYINAFKYDGKEHKVEVVGLPEGVTIGGYNGNTATVVGDYTAKVTLTYDANNYNAPSVADLNWKVENNWTPSEYTVNGDGWMNQDFVITANDGYKVSLNSIANGEWKDALTYSAETDNGSVTFYLKNETDGTISLAKTVTYKLDKTAPTGTVEFVDRTGWQEFVNTITFGLFYKDDVTVKITGADNLSGVAKVEYYVSDEALTLDQVKTITDWTDYSDSFGVSVEDTKKFVYYVRITDNAGNVTYISTDGAEYDITAPVISGIENGNTYYTTQKVTVTDKNLDTVTLNGNAVTETVTLDGDKDVTYTIVATDKAGNSTTVTVTMKPISDLSVPIDALNKDNVNGGDEQTVDGVKAAVATVDTTNATDEEKAALKEIADKANELEKVIDDTKAEITRIEEELNKHDDATVNSDDTVALEQLAKDIKELLDGDNLTDAERTALTENAGKVEDMQKTVADTTAENKRISDAVDGYDLATVTSDDKADLEQLLADIEKQLESTNLTEEEISELNGDKKAVEDLLTKIKGTDELIDKLIEDVNEYGDETVKSTDKDAIEQIIEDIDALLETENLTEDEKKDLEDAKDKAEGLLETIDGADKATDTEDTEKVKDVTSENVTPEDKTDLEKAKADLEKALEDYGNNYTDDEKKAIEDEIKRIDDALEVIENVENVEELIGKIPENITKNDEAAIKAADDAYNALTDYEKSLVDEDAKKALDDAKAALAELNKPTDPNSPQTGDNSNLWLWFALLFVSGAGVFGITLNERKRRTANKR